MADGRIHAIVLKVAGLCNLNCSYCYIYNHEDKSYLRRPPEITDEVYDATLERMLEHCLERAPHSMTIGFHGGEPTLIGAARFDELAARAEERLGEHLMGLAIQTNATLIDDAWVEVLKRHAVHVGVSLDGPEEVHDRVRVNHAGRGTYCKTLTGLERLRRGGLDPRILCVIDPGRSGAGIYRHFRSLGITQMDFLLPDVSHDNYARWYGDRGEAPVAEYLIPIFDSWFEEDKPEVRVRLFWEMVRSLLGGTNRTDLFGNPMLSYLIVDTDGSIEALDALRVCEDRIADSGLNVLEKGFGDLASGLPVVSQAVYEGFPLPTGCRECPERELCGGGYLPHRYSRSRGFDNPSVWCADILKIFSHVRHRVGEVAELVC